MRDSAALTNRPAYVHLIRIGGISVERVFNPFDWAHPASDGLKICPTESALFPPLLIRGLSFCLESAMSAIDRPARGRPLILTHQPKQYLTRHFNFVQRYPFIAGMRFGDIARTKDNAGNAGLRNGRSIGAGAPARRTFNRPICPLDKCRRLLGPRAGACSSARNGEGTSSPTTAAGNWPEAASLAISWDEPPVDLDAAAIGNDVAGPHRYGDAQVSGR